jgi:hypothetical protein
VQLGLSGYAVIPSAGVRHGICLTVLNIPTICCPQGRWFAAFESFLVASLISNRGMGYGGYIESSIRPNSTCPLPPLLFLPPPLPILLYLPLSSSSAGSYPPLSPSILELSTPLVRHHQRHRYERAQPAAVDAVSKATCPSSHLEKDLRDVVKAIGYVVRTLDAICEGIPWP